MAGRLYESNDHFDPSLLQFPDDRERAGDLQQQIQALAEDCVCLGGGACSSGKHERYRAVVRELLTNNGSDSMLRDVSSCADVLFAMTRAMEGSMDSVALGLDSLCTVGGVIGQVLDEHPHNVLSMIRTIAEVPRRTSTAMSARSNTEMRKMLSAAPIHGA
ncbi:hypothetical protein BGZ65_012423, partial [Modicella reniformis]